MQDVTIDKSIRAVLGLPLTWRRTRMIPAAYEFRAGDDVLARLRSVGVFSRQMRVDVCGRTWRIRKPSLFSRRILLEDWDAGTQAAEYRGAFRQGLLRIGDGGEFRFTRAGFLPRRIQVFSSGGSAILRVEWGWVSFGQVATTTVESAGSAEPELDLIALMAFVVLLLRRRRAARSSAGS